MSAAALRRERGAPKMLYNSRRCLFAVLVLPCAAWGLFCLGIVVLLCLRFFATLRFVALFPIELGSHVHALPGKPPLASVSAL